MKMALVLNVKKGEGFWVVDSFDKLTDTRYVVESILNECEFVLRKDGTDLAYRVGPDPRAVENGIVISSGDNTSRHSVRVLIDAPRTLKILRDKLYENDHASHYSSQR
jgi:hypothetical protein